MSYSLTAQRRDLTQYVDINVYAREDKSWSTMLISYIFCGRTDLAVGNFEVDYFYWKDLSPGVKEVTHGIKNILPANQDYQIATFVSGFSTSSSNPLVSISNSWFDEQAKQLGVIFAYNTNQKAQFDGITFTYIIYPRVHPVLQFDYTQIITNNLGSYYVTGPVSLRDSKVVYNAWRIVNRNIPCNGPKCQGRTCILIEDCNNQGGNYWQGQCFFCNDGIIFDSGRCLRTCGANQVSFNRLCFCQNGFVRNGVDCVKENSCGTNQVWDVKTKTCICDINSYFFAQKCTRCPVGSFPTEDGLSCICADVSKQFKPLTSSCENRCFNNQSWQTKKCDCVDNFRWSNGECARCPDDGVPNAEKTTCLCPNNRYIYIAGSNACELCPSNSSPNAAKTACECNSGYELNKQNNCVRVPPFCNKKVEVFNPDTFTCDCIYGFQRIGPGGPCISKCAINEAWSGKECVCSEGFSRFNGQPCRECPASISFANQERTYCLCKNPNSVFNPDTLKCEVCPPNSSPTADDTKCLCNAGWTPKNNACASDCASNSSPDSKGVCVCNSDFYPNAAKVCIPRPICPPNSQWNTALLQCQCQIAGQNLINGICQACPANEGWNGVKCICQEGLHRVDGTCKACSKNGLYNGNSCECNDGFFGNGLVCTACHASCNRCEGTEANQCIQCADIALTLENGLCSKVGPCEPGLYLEGGVCSQCGENCIHCSSLFECSTCANGFEALDLDFGGQTVTVCSEVCGDGLRFTEQCDDKNLKNGDGCNEFCEVEDEWYCSGGTPLKRDNCVQTIPKSVVLTNSGAVNLGNTVAIQIKANYLPPCMTDFDCNNCQQALAASIVTAVNYASFTIKYNPFTKYQWSITVNFDEIISSPFKVVLKLNPAYKTQARCFSDDDFNQQLSITIDPSTLVLAESLYNLPTIDDFNL